MVGSRACCHLVAAAAALLIASLTSRRPMKSKKGYPRALAFSRIAATMYCILPACRHPSTPHSSICNATRLQEQSGVDVTLSGHLASSFFSSVPGPRTIGVDATAEAVDALRQFLGEPQKSSGTPHTTHALVTGSHLHIIVMPACLRLLWCPIQFRVANCPLILRPPEQSRSMIDRRAWNNRRPRLNQF